MDIQDLGAQVGIAAAAVTLFLTVGKSYVNYISKQSAEQQERFTAELARLTASWEARLSDANKRADSWENAAHRYEQAGAEDREQVRKLHEVVQTVVQLLTALREEQMRR